MVDFLDHHSVENNFLQLCRTFNWDLLDIQTRYMIQILSRQQKLQQRNEMKGVASDKELQSGREGNSSKKHRTENISVESKNREHDMWDEFRDKVQECAFRNLTMTDEFGNTALHLACYHQAPLQSIKYLLDLSKLVSISTAPIVLRSRTATTEPPPKQIQRLFNPPKDKDHLDLRLKLANDGSTPFLVACAFYPNCDLSFLILKGEKDYSITNQDRRRGIIHFQEKEEDILSACETRRVRQVAIQPDQNGSTPLLEIFRGYGREIGDTDNRLRTSTHFNLNTSSSEAQQHKQRILRSKITLILRAATAKTRQDLLKALKCEEHNSDFEYHHFVLKALATVPHACINTNMFHESLMHCGHLDQNLLIKLFHLSITNSVLKLLTTKQSWNGVFMFSKFNESETVAIDAKQPSSLIFVNTQRQLQVLCDSQCDVIKGFLGHSPNITRVLVPVATTTLTKTSDFKDKDYTFTTDTSDLVKKQWRTPLCHAIASGLWWSSACESIEKTEGVDDASGPLCSIWKCAPEALESRDLITGLYPFMVAATVTYNKNLVESGTCVESKLSTLQMGNIYGLLRTNPQVMDMVLNNKNYTNPKF